MADQRQLPLELPLPAQGTVVILRMDDLQRLFLGALPFDLAGNARSSAPAPSAGLAPDAEREQVARPGRDCWHDQVRQWIEGRASDRCYERFNLADRGKGGEPLEFSVADVLTYALQIEPSRQGRQEATRVGSILQGLGWRSYRTTRRGKRVRLYYRPSRGPGSD